MENCYSCGCGLLHWKGIDLEFVRVSIYVRFQKFQMWRLCYTLLLRLEVLVSWHQHVILRMQVVFLVFLQREHFWAVFLWCSNIQALWIGWPDDWSPSLGELLEDKSPQLHHCIRKAWTTLRILELNDDTLSKLPVLKVLGYEFGH